MAGLFFPSSFRREARGGWQTLLLQGWCCLRPMKSQAEQLRTEKGRNYIHTVVFFFF